MKIDINNKKIILKFDSVDVYGKQKYIEKDYSFTNIYDLTNHHQNFLLEIEALI